MKCSDEVKLRSLWIGSSLREGNPTYRSRRSVDSSTCLSSPTVVRPLWLMWYHIPHTTYHNGLSLLHSHRPEHFRYMVTVT